MFSLLFTPAPFAAGARRTIYGGLILATVAAVAGRLLRWHRRRITIVRLQELDDRILKDIGLGRGEIEGHIRRTDPESGHRIAIQDRARFL